jgi:hypothetical protein
VLEHMSTNQQPGEMPQSLGNWASGLGPRALLWHCPQQYGFLDIGGAYPSINEEDKNK